MGKDTINRAIQRGAGGQEGQNLEEVIYEGYGPEGIAVFIKTLTDNKNRTVSEIRHAFTKSGGNLGTSGSVAYMFKSIGKIFVNNSSTDEKIYELAIESGAEDILDLGDEKTELHCDPKNLSELKGAIENKSFDVESTEILMESENQIKLDLENSEKILKLTDSLEDLDDVQEVFTNAELDSEVFEK